MEIKAEILKPYTENEKMNFIVEENHNKGYEIKETEESLQAWGYTEEEIIAEREEQFERDFFLTSLGYIRRKVTMATGETKDFLSDLLPTISMAIQIGQEVKVIAYDKPDFTQEIIDWEQYQHNEVVTAQFVQECFMQLSSDFGVVKNDNQTNTDKSTNVSRV